MDPVVPAVANAAVVNAAPAPKPAQSKFLVDRHLYVKYRCHIVKCQKMLENVVINFFFFFFFGGGAIFGSRSQLFAT